MAAANPERVNLAPLRRGVRGRRDFQTWRHFLRELLSNEEARRYVSERAANSRRRKGAFQNPQRVFYKCTCICGFIFVTANKACVQTARNHLNNPDHQRRLGQRRAANQLGR